MAKPTTSASKNAPDTSIPTTSLLGTHPRGSLLEQLLREPCPPLRSTGGQPIADSGGPILAPPSWPHPLPQLPRDLFDLDIEKPDKEEIIRELLRWMMHIDIGCDCPEEEAGADGAPPGGRKLQWCQAMEDLMEHATQCTAWYYCSVANCALANRIFGHSETCRLTGCFVCAAAKPFRRNTAGRYADDDGSNTDAKQQAHLQSVQRSIQSLIHAGQCRDAGCQLSNCQQMKHAISHTKAGSRKCKKGACYICETLFPLCCHHAESCKEDKCMVPFCPQIRQKWKHYGQQQYGQRQQFESRRAAILHRFAHGSLDGGGDAPNPNQNVQSPQSTMWMAGERHYPPGMGTKGDSGASSAIRETLVNMPVNNLGGSLNPLIQSSVAPNGTAHRATASRAAVNRSVAFVQPPPQRTAGTTATPYEQLVEALNRPPSLEQQQHVANIMRGNPELVAGFLRLARLENRHTQHEQQQCYDLNQSAISGTRFDLKTAGDTGAKASAQDVFIPVGNTTKITYDWKTWIPKQLRTLQRTPWQCKFTVCMAAVLIAGVLSFFFGLFIGTEYN